MDKFLKNHKLPKLTQGEIAVTIQDTEIKVKNLLKNEISRSRWFHWRILPSISRRIAPIHHELFQKIEEVAIFPNSFFFFFLRPLSPGHQNQVRRVFKKKKHNTNLHFSS